MKRVNVWMTWVVWGVVTAGMLSYLLVTLFVSSDRTLFMPGQTTAGHYQIELQCSACHGTLADGSIGEVRQSSCLDCHQEELERVGDAHPIAKFAKPIDALKLQPIDGAMSAKNVQTRFCITCHQEHQPNATRPMGLTQPEDYCMSCHGEIQKERDTHKGLAFTTCLTAGCHNFHDNSALFEQFLTDHRHDAPMKPAEQALQPQRDLGMRFAAELAQRGKATAALLAAQMDAPATVSGGNPSPQVLHDWESTAHARAGVNCNACHLQPDEKTHQPTWIDRPSYTSCKTCHDQETHGFLGSRHGMRLAEGLDPMRPELARLPMKTSAAKTELSCNTCHSAHTFDTKVAAFQACVQCHDDQHTRNYEHSTHHALWLDEMAGRGAPGSGVSCATCHFPRVVESEGDRKWVEVKHNQNDFLRPNEKMVRASCLHCHGLPFALDALADQTLINANFDRQPAGPHFTPSSFDMIDQKLDRLRKEGRLSN